MKRNIIGTTTNVAVHGVCKYSSIQGYLPELSFPRKRETIHKDNTVFDFWMDSRLRGNDNSGK